MKQRVNPALVTIARESRSMRQEQLAQRLGVSQGKLSKYENGMLQVSEDDLKSLSNVLGYTEEFFCQPDDVLGTSTVCIHHRKRASVPVGQLKVIHAQINIFRMQVPRLMHGVAVETTNQFHHLDVDEFDGPQAVAIELRRLWKLPLGPVRNLIGAIERAGGIVWKVDFGSRQIDAVSQVAAGFPPVFFVNALAPGDRLRFTMAHELGHVVMHQLMPSPKMEDEADRFASEFLMPAAQIGSSLRQLSFEQLPSLKGHWKVAMAALIKRAADLEKISDRHYRTMFTQLSKSGWRLKEPVEIPIENPTVLRNVLRVRMHEHGLSLLALTKEAFLTKTAEFKERFLTDEEPTLKVVG